jgi:glycosyltransferase involved in cell wall biosynthesis
MGRLHKVKVFDILIKSFSKVLQTYSDTILLIAGKDVGEKDNLKALVKEYELEHSVYFIGEVSDQDKIDFLGNADLFVLASHTENFGNVYVESLAAGTPIVASRGTPWQEVEYAKCGKWVENSIEKTSQAILEMLQKDREELRTNARKLAEKYDWENIALQFKDVFKAMIEGS